jgi:tetratricopeptide (TPR) repeat protein
MKIRKFAVLSVLVFGTIAANDVAPSNSELEAMYDKAYRAFDAANYTEALKQLDAIDARKPDLAASQNLRGVVYMRQGLYDKAEAALSEARGLDPKFWNARFNLAEIPFLKKDWAEARKRFQELLTSNAAELQGEAAQLIQYKILLTYLLEGNDTMVDSILAKFELSPDTPAVHYANAAISLQGQNIPDAKNWMSAAEKNFSPQLNKLFAESLYEIGWLKKQPGQQRPAVQLLSPEERASKTKVVAKTAFEQGLQAYEQRDFDSAARLAEQADTAEPNQPQVLNLRGAILLEQQKYDEAERFFKQALKADSKFREAQFNLADVPFRNKDYAEARDRFQALLKQTPGGDKNQAAQLINFRVFLTYLLEGKDSRAQKLMEQFQFSGDTPALYYAEAAWEFKHDNADKANDWITSARKIYPSASNAMYAAGFYDLGWLKNAMAVSSPSPTASVSGAAVASTQTESSVPAIEPSPIPGVEVKADEGTQLALAQTPALSPAGSKASEAIVNPTLAEVIVSNAKATGTSARPEDLPAAPAAPGISVESPSANATPSPALALATAGPASTPAIAATSDVSVVTAPIVASTPEASSPTPAPAATIAAPTAAPDVAAPAAAPELAAGTPTQQPVIEPAASAPPVVTTVISATPAPVLAPAKVGQFTPVPTFGERISSFTGQRPLLVWILGLSGFGLLVSVVVMEIRRRIGTTQIGHRPATVTGPPLHDNETVEEAPALQVQKRFAGGPRQISVQLKASEPSMRRAVIPVAKRAPETITALLPEPETATVNGRGEPTYVDFEESSVGPAIAQMPSNGQREVVPEVAASASPVYDEPVLEQAERQAAAAVTEDTFPIEPVREWEAPEPVEAPANVLEMQVCEPTTAETAAAASKIEEQISTQEWSPEPEPEPIEQGQPVPYQTLVTAEEPIQTDDAQESEIAEIAGVGRAIAEDTFPSEPVREREVSEPVEAPANVLEMQVREPTATPSEIEEHISSQEWSPEPEPIAQGLPVPYQTVVTAEEPAEIAVREEREIATVAEITGVGRAIAGISALPEAPEIPTARDEEHFAPQPTPIETMPETLQTPTAPVIRTSGAPTQPAHPAPVPQAAAGGMHTAVQITLSCEIASMQLTPTFKMGALQLRPISKVVTMRLASSPPQQAPMNLQANFEISKIQAAPGSLGQLRLNPSQQQGPAMLATPSFNISSLQLVSGFDSAPLQLTPSHQTQASVHLTAAFQITSVEVSPTFEIAGLILNSTSKTVAVQLPGAGASSVENAPMFEITNVQMASNGEIAMLQLNPVAKRG